MQPYNYHPLYFHTRAHIGEASYLSTLFPLWSVSSFLNSLPNLPVKEGGRTARPAEEDWKRALIEEWYHLGSPCGEEVPGAAMPEGGWLRGGGSGTDTRHLCFKPSAVHWARDPGTPGTKERPTGSSQRRVAPPFAVAASARPSAPPPAAARATRQARLSTTSACSSRPAQHAFPQPHSVHVCVASAGVALPSLARSHARRCRRRRCRVRAPTAAAPARRGRCWCAWA